MSLCQQNPVLRQVPIKLVSHGMNHLTEEERLSGS